MKIRKGLTSFIILITLLTSIMGVSANTCESGSYPQDDGFIMYSIYKSSGSDKELVVKDHLSLRESNTHLLSTDKNIAGEDILGFIEFSGILGEDKVDIIANGPKYSLSEGQSLDFYQDGNFQYSVTLDEVLTKSIMSSNAVKIRIEGYGTSLDELFLNANTKKYDLGSKEYSITLMLLGDDKDAVFSIRENLESEEHIFFVEAGSSFSYSGVSVKYLSFYNPCDYVCSDTDGEDIRIKGSVRDISTLTAKDERLFDSCTNGNVGQVNEYLCINGMSGVRNYDCPTGTVCSDGACVSSATKNEIQPKPISESKNSDDSSQSASSAKPNDAEYSDSINTDSEQVVVVKEKEPVQENIVVQTSPICNGCEAENKCIPYGTRTEESYCDLSGSLMSIKGEEQTCNNNYECGTNLCVNSKCVSPGIIDKFFSWISRVFFG